MQSQLVTKIAISKIRASFCAIFLTIAAQSCGGILNTPANPTITNHAPVLTSSVAASVAANATLPISLTATDADGDEVTFSVVDSPAHGVLTGTGVEKLYTPNPGYQGSETFTYKASDGTADSDLGTITFTVAPAKIYLRAAGVVDDLPPGAPAPVLTTQAAINAAIALVPSPTNPVIIDVGSLSSGNFGDAAVTQDFGADVTWVGHDLVHSVIGNISADSVNGRAGVNNGDDISHNGVAATKALNLTVLADANVQFGNVTANGGGGGEAYCGLDHLNPYGGNGGEGGTVIVRGKFVDVRADGGPGGTGAGDCALGSGLNGGNGGKSGSVTVLANSSANILSAAGGVGGLGIEDQIIPSAGYTGFGGDGGTVQVDANATAVLARASGGDGGGQAGLGGTITSSGMVATLSANGGNGAFAGGYGTGAEGGRVNLNVGSVSANVIASGGTGAGYFIGNGGDGARGGQVVVRGRVNGNISAMGGDGYGMGGLGGTVTLKNGAVCTDSAVVTGGEGGNTGEGGGPGGTIMVEATASVVYAHAEGGGDGASPSGGRGGSITTAGIIQKAYATGGFGNSGGDVTVSASGLIVDIFNITNGSSGASVIVNGTVTGSINANAFYNSTAANVTVNGTASLIEAKGYFGGTVVINGEAGDVTVSSTEGGVAGSITVNSGATAADLYARADDIGLGGSGGQVSASGFASIGAVDISGDIANGGANGSFSVIP